MAELMTFLIALPFLYVIGDFYYRLGAWLCEVLRSAVRTVAAWRHNAAPCRAGRNSR